MSVFQGSSSVANTLSDLDGFTVQGDHFYSTMQSNAPYTQPDTDDFGFDPPSGLRSAFPIKMEQSYSPPEDSIAGFDSFDHLKDDNISPTNDMPGLEIDRMIAQALPNASTAVSRYGQVTPPRSNSESSVPEKRGNDTSSQMPERRKRASCASLKDDQAATTTTSTGRKRRNTRKTPTATISDPEDEKRRQSLEKNRLAAAKCRVNKKEKTEQLQRDSHDKAVQNAFLKEQVMRMKEEVQQMNALLLSHANCEGCKSPDDIQKHLSDLGNEFYAHHMGNMNTNHDFGGFPSLSDLERDSVIHENYFSPVSDPSLMNPPLPDFDREPNFEVTTPMHTD